MANLPVSGEWTNSGPELPAQIFPVVAQPVAISTKLNVVLPFIESDIPQVIRLLKWCAELSGKIPYSIFLLPFKGINFTEVKMYAERAFSDVQIIPDAEGIISDWKSDAKIKDAAGPNSMFRQAAWYFYFHQKLGPWLYLEPDCVPLTKDWLQELEADHKNAGVAISGVKMEWADEPYLNGVAIYPSNLINVSPEIVTRVMWEQHPEKEVAFDVAGRHHVLQKAHLTKKIQLNYRQDATRKFNAGAVLYHGDRTGSVTESLLQGEKKEDDASCSTVPDTPRSNGAADVQPVASARLFEHFESDNAMSIGDKIRFHCGALLEIVTENEWRKKQIIAELRKRKLVPQAKKR